MAEGHLKSLDENLEKFAWDGEWYVRAYRADGLKFGSKENKEASIFLEPQPWLSSAAILPKNSRKIARCCEQTFINRLRTYDLRPAC